MKTTDPESSSNDRVDTRRPMRPYPSNLRPPHEKWFVPEDLPVARLQGRAVQAVLESGLSRLFRTEGIPPTLAPGAAVAEIDGGSFRLWPGAKPVNTAAQVAQAVYGGLNQ